MTIELDGSKVTSLSAFHAEMARLLDFGPYYGANLDALWDRLTTDVERPVHLVWTHAQLSRNALGPGEYIKLVSLLEEVAERDREFGRTDRFEIEIRD